MRHSRTLPPHPLSAPRPTGLARTRSSGRVVGLRTRLCGPVGPGSTHSCGALAKLAKLVVIFFTVTHATPGLAAESAPASETPTLDPQRAWFVEPGLALPYPLHRLLQGWSPCKAAGTHRGLDITGAGADAGLGTPVRAVMDAEVVEIGLPADDPGRFGTPLPGGGEVVRAGVHLPSSREVPGYGEVRFFTEDHGSMRTGTLLRMRILAGPLARHTAIYMHLAAVHPDVRVGETVRAGQEVGLLGGTAVQNDPPHLHFEVRSPRGEALDPGRVLKFGPTSIYCHDKPSTRNAQRLRFQVAADALMRRLGEAGSAPAPSATRGP
jgi:hypothetical protein